MTTGPAVDGSMFGPTSCPRDNSRHEVYAANAPNRGSVTYCRKCGKEWSK